VKGRRGEAQLNSISIQPGTGGPSKANIACAALRTGLSGMGGPMQLVWFQQANQRWRWRSMAWELWGKQLVLLHLVLQGGPSGRPLMMIPQCDRDLHH
jgi:hypothetical protein